MGRATVLSDSSVALREEKAPARSEYSGDGGKLRLGKAALESHMNVRRPNWPLYTAC